MSSVVGIKRCHQPNINLQKIVRQKYSETVNKILAAVINLLKKFHNTSIDDFSRKIIKPRLPEIYSNVDIKIGKLFYDVLKVFNKELERRPDLVQSFAKLNGYEKGLTGELIVTTAFPFVKELKANLSTLYRPRARVELSNAHKLGLSLKT